MKIHEYQGKEIFRKYGVPVPRGYPAFSVDEAVKVAKDAAGPGLRGQGADPRRRTRQGRRREARALPGRSEDARLADPRHAAQDAPDRPRGPEGAAAPGRGGRRHQEGAVRRDGRRPRRAARHADGFLRGRHGHRGGGRQDAREDPQGRDRPGQGPDRRRSRRRRAQDRRAGGERAAGARGVPGALQGVRRDRRLARRDQPADPHRRRPRGGARRQAQLRLQRAVPPSRDRRDARPRRGGPGRDRGIEVRPLVHLAQRQHRLPRQRRRPRDGDDGHDQAVRRRARELPRRRRRRHDREGDRGVQDHARQPQGEGDPGQHLRRHHALRHDRQRHRRRGEGDASRPCRWWCA